MAIYKKRYWSFVIYPESLPSEWRQIIADSGLPTAISPLHDQDLNPTGELKKPHYHGICCFDGPTTLNSVKSFTDKLNAPNPQGIESVKGYYRYFTHQDNPEKAQYNKKDIQHFNGFNPLDFDTLTRSEELEIKTNIFKFIQLKEIIEYCDLLDSLQGSQWLNEFEYATNHTILFNNYLTSKRNKFKDNYYKETKKPCYFDINYNNSENDQKE